MTKDGKIVYFPSYQITFTCKMNLRFFPYDTQKCRLTFGSWVHNSRVLNITDIPENVGVLFSEYGYLANDFLFLNATGERISETYECCPDAEFVTVRYTIQLKRVSGSYGVKLVLPAVISGFLVLATFLLPPTSYEKITLCGLVFVALLLQLSYLHDIVPTSGDTILGEYLAFVVIIDFFATVFAVLSYNVRLSQSGKQPEAQPETEGDFNDLRLLVPRMVGHLTNNS